MLALRYLVISPHLDDGVFGCGQLLAAHPGSTVLTVFAGVPDGAPAPEWDRRCGFTSAAAAMAARREEDRRALTRLAARPLWLRFLDSQYGRPPSLAALCDALRGAIQALAPGAFAPHGRPPALAEDAAPLAVLVPMGLFHSDHELVHEAALAVLQEPGAPPTLAYEDALYRRKPGLLQRRLAALAAAGWCATPAALGPLGAPADKRRAVQAYASQLRAFGRGGWSDVLEPERYWQLTPPPTAPRSGARETADDLALAIP